MDIRQKMMVFAYGIYLQDDQGLEFSTLDSYKQKAQAYYNGKREEKPKYLEEAEELIGFN